MKNRWIPDAQVRATLRYALSWATCGKVPLLEGEIALSLQRLLQEKAKELGVTIDKLDIRPDHVRMMIISPPTHAPHYLVAQLKSHSWRGLAPLYPAVRTRLASLWTRTYAAQSIGTPNMREIEEFLCEQKVRRKKTPVEAEEQIRLPLAM